MNDPDFKSAYLALREVEADIARAELRGLALKDAITLSRAMDNEDPNISLRAAQTAIKASVKDTEDAKKVVGSYPNSPKGTTKLSPPANRANSTTKFKE